MPSLLPDYLPATEAIMSSNDVLHESSACRIVRVGVHFVDKYGVGVSLIEGENMLFVKQFSGVPVLEIYALYSS